MDPILYLASVDMKFHDVNFTPLFLVLVYIFLSKMVGVKIESFKMVSTLIYLFSKDCNLAFRFYGMR